MEGMDMKRPIVCGGRDFHDAEFIWTALSDLYHEHGRFEILICGAAFGADAHAAEWAREWKVPTKLFPADWKANGRAAGPIRNQRMIDEGKPDGCVAFPGGRGTADMKRRAEAAGITVIEPSRHKAAPNNTMAG